MTLPNLEPEQCLTIMDQIHAKKFLGRKIYVTSVVSMSPTKVSPTDPSQQTDSSSPKPPPKSPMKPSPELSASSVSQSDNSQLVVPVLPSLKPRNLVSFRSSSLTSLTDFNFKDIELSPAGVKDKVAEMETMFALPSKRKAVNSPETADPSKKEKKLNKKDVKNKSKIEQKEAAKLVSPSKIL